MSPFLDLEDPVVNASGTFDAIAARRAFGDALLERFPFAAFVTKTVTIAPRQGNPAPRLFELPSGLLNSIGLPNKGLEGFLQRGPAEARATARPADRQRHGRRPRRGRRTGRTGGRARRGHRARAQRLLPERQDRPDVRRRPARGRPASWTRFEPGRRKPLIVKLTPNCASPADVAAAAEAHGADAVSLINTLRGMAPHPHRPGEPWLGGKTGGVSGPAVRAVAIAQVSEVRGRVRVPIVGMGGVQSGRHALDLLRAGADLVAVGTESFRDPLAGERVRRELRALLPGRSFVSR